MIVDRNIENNEHGVTCQRNKTNKDSGNVTYTKTQTSLTITHPVDNYRVVKTPRMKSLTKRKSPNWSSGVYSSYEGIECVSHDLEGTPRKKRVRTKGTTVHGSVTHHLSPNTRTQLLTGADDSGK